MELEHQMLVSEYAQNVINNRPLKYGTRPSYIKIIKSLGIWDTEISDLNCALIFDKVDQMRSHNVKKNVYICLRSVFKDLGIFNELPILQGIAKQYDFPTQEFPLQKVPHRNQIQYVQPVPFDETHPKSKGKFMPV